MNRLFLVLLSLGAFGAQLSAQELTFNVRVNTQRLQTVDPRVFESLEQTLVEFLNNQKWTTDIYEPTERINCNILLTLQNELSPTRFEVDIAIQSSRPVYGSDYETPVLNHYDAKVVFDYEQYQPIQFNKNVFNNNLASVLGFYVYVILGFDYDTFSPLGGEQYFQAALEVVNTVPSSATGTFKGWVPQDGDRNRYWLIENILSPRVRPLRRLLYDYHRNGLDVMSTNVEQGRAAIAQALTELEKVNQAYPNSMIIPTFMAAKRDEIIEIFKRGTISEQNQVIITLSKIDPSQSNRYQEIR